jgi:glycosyltransferase involved in cell wall biosynthesis
VATALVEQAGSYDPRIVGRVRRLIATFAPDVVVGHDYKANLVLAAAARRTGIPRAAVVHGYTGEDRKIRVFEAVDRRLLRRVEVAVAVSAATREALVESGVDPARVRLVENAIDVEAAAADARAGRVPLRAAFGATDGDLVVLALGRLSPEKGHAVLVEAFREVVARVPAARLVLVGDGVLEPALRRAAAPLGERVVFAGWRADPGHCLGAADVFALPSLREGLPLAVLEAMAAGVPVVASAVGGVPAALADGAAGVLVPPGDPGALAAALARLLADPERRQTLRDAAGHRVRAHHEIDGHVAALERLWLELHRAGPTCR